MKKNYNFNYINRQAAKKAAIEYRNVELATCTSKVLAKTPVTDGKLWHATDTNEFYYDWNGKRNKLNLTGGGSDENLTAEINKIKADVAKLNPAKMDQLESKVNNAVSKVNNITSTVNSAVADAQAATQAANEAAAAVNDKVSQSELQEAINNISLTPGEKGEKGDKGDQGEKGEKGDKGDQGLPGADGAKGDKGEPGEKGEKGDKGDQGEKGDKGDAGEKGDKGDKGDQGEKGDKGDKGDAGEKGEKGEKGDQGEKGDKGDQGLPGADGAKGDKGDQGEKGEKGDKGDQGEKGEKGDKGDQGEPGEKGDKGDAGEKGEKGDKGDQGLPGADGTDGVDGLDGKDGKSAYELYLDSVSTDKEFLIVDHTNFAQARHNELEDYYNNYPTEASQDGEDWPPFTAGAFPWIVVNHVFDGNTVLKLFYKGNEVLSYTPTAEVEREDGTSVARTYAIIGVPSIDPDVFNEFAETVEGTDNLLNANDFEVKLVSAADNLTVDEWLASLKGEKGEPGDGADVEIPTMVSAFTNDADYTTRGEVTDRLGIIGSDEESNQYEYIYDEASWNASYADGVLKEYYEANPSEDLWNEVENRPVNFNDKVYTAKVYLDAAGEGEYETKQFAAYWLSEEVQRLTEVGSENVYYIPMFYDVPNAVFEMFCNAPGGAMAKAADLADSSAHYIRIESADFTGAGVGHSWQAASDNNGARFPWIAVNFNGGVKKYIKFEYEGKDVVYPWGDKTFGTGVKTWGIASVAKEWEDNGFLIEKNKNNGDENWDGELGVDFGQFDINKFKMILVTPSTVKEYVDASVASIAVPELPENIATKDYVDESIPDVSGLITIEETSARLGMDPDTVLDEYEFIYDENSWNTSFANGVLKKYYEEYPDEDLVSTTDPSKTAGFNDRIYIGTITGSDDVVRFKATWQEKSQKITNMDNPSEVYYIERLDPTSPYYGTENEWKAQYAKFHGSSWVLYSDAALTTPVDDKEFAIETLTFDGFTHSYQAWVANGAKAPWVAIDTTNMSKKIIRFEYEGKDAVYPWSETRFGTGDKVWGIASLPTEWQDNTFLTEDTKDNGKNSWIGEKGVDFGQFDINKFKIMLVSPVKDYVDASIAEIDIPEIIEGVFPAGNNIENVNATEDGVATVQDVMNYVRAYFEKKKDELEDSDSDVPVIPYAYITGYALNGEPTNITVFNQFELNESGDTAIEVIAPQEIGAWDPSTNDDLPSIKMTVDVPAGYTPTALYIWNVLTNEYQLLTGDNDFAQNPRYESRTINGVTYNSYVRGSADDVNTRGETQYKIIITKE